MGGRGLVWVGAGYCWSEGDMPRTFSSALIQLLEDVRKTQVITLHNTPPSLCTCISSLSLENSSACVVIIAPLVRLGWPDSLNMHSVHESVVCVCVCMFLIL